MQLCRSLLFVLLLLPTAAHAAPPTSGSSPGEGVIVRFVDGASPGLITALLDEVDGVPVYQSPYTGAFVIEVPAFAAEATVQRLRAHPAVRFSGVNHRTRATKKPKESSGTSEEEPQAPTGSSNDGGSGGGGGAQSGGGGHEEENQSAAPNDFLAYQWALHAHRVPEAWAMTDNLGNGVTVAVLDTGVAETPSLLGRVWPHADFIGGGAESDDNGHGTHMASLIAGAGPIYGVAPGARILPIKVLAADLSGTEMALVDGLYHAAAHPAVGLISMSLTFPTSYYPSDLLTEAVEYVASMGIPMFAAAGNDGEATVGFPARFPHVAAVGAVGMDGGESVSGPHGTFKHSPYSNHGGALDFVACGGGLGTDVDGDGIPDGILGERGATANGPQGAYLTAGTSPATAQAAGAAALLLANGADPGSIRYMLQVTAHGPDFSANFGSGVIDVADALAAGLSGQAGRAPEKHFASAVLYFTRSPHAKDPGRVSPVALVEVRDESGAPRHGVEVWGHFGGLLGTYVSAKTDPNGVATLRPNDVYNVDTGFVGLSIDAVIDTHTGTPIRPIGAVTVERNSYELIANTGAGFASSAIVVGYDSGSFAGLQAYQDPQTVVPTWTLRSFGTGFASSALVFAMTPNYYQTSGIAQYTMPLRSLGTGLVSSALVFDQQLFSMARQATYGVDQLWVRSGTRGTGLVSSAILWDGTQYPFSSFFYGHNPQILSMAHGSGLVSSALVWDWNFFNPALLTQSLSNWNPTTTGTGLVSSAIVSPFTEYNTSWLGFDFAALTATYPHGSGLVSSALVATFDPYGYLSGAYGAWAPGTWFVANSAQSQIAFPY